MPFTKEKCPKCGKDAETVKAWLVGNKRALTLKCGHMLIKPIVESERDLSNLESLDGKRLFSYQVDGANFGLKSGGRCLIADEMRLGKTVQALAMLAANADMFPCLIIVKSSLKMQWLRECYRWLGTDKLIQVISESSDVVIPGMNIYIIGYDLIARFRESKKGKKKKAIIEKIADSYEKYQWINPYIIPNPLKEKLNAIQTVILDECQQIKNSTAGRTIEVRELCKGVKHIIALSGTPIKNNAGEFFPVLNIIRPDLFHTEVSFLRQDCSSYYTGTNWKVGAIKDPEAWKEKTKDFIIRRTRAEVMPDMPMVFRNNRFCELGKEVELAYKKTLRELEDALDTEGQSSFERESCLLAYINKMRHLAGIAKIDDAIDFVMEYIPSSTNKLVIFTHHKDVRFLLFEKLKSLFGELELAPPVMLADVVANEKQAVVDKWLNDEQSRILIASTIADGEGVTMSKQGITPDAIMAEREWNPANEEQAESRFPNVLNSGDKVNITYLVAVGTIDEMFAEIVEKKREIVGKTMSGEAIDWNQSDIMKELMERLSMTGAKRWRV